MRRIIALVTGSLLALTACGSTTTTSFAGEGGVLASISSTTAEKTSKADLSMTLTGTGGADVTLNGSGAFDYENESGFINMSAPVEGDSINIESRFVDGIVYVRTTDASGQVVTPKPWIRLDVAALAEQQGLGSTFSQGSSSPLDGLDALRSAGSNITEIGTETLRGDETTHYRVQLEPAEMANSDDAETRTQGEALVKVYGTEPMPADVWIDDLDRVRKVSMTIDLAKLNIPEAGETGKIAGTVTMSYEFYDFGTEVDVVAPSADEVMDFSEAEAAATQQQRAA